MTNRHRVFVSYYHAEDQGYRDRFERLFVDTHDIMVSESIEIGDIDPNLSLSTEQIRKIIRDDYLRDSTVTVVLVGAHTWPAKVCRFGKLAPVYGGQNLIPVPDF